MRFDDPSLLDALATIDAAALDALTFGAVGLDRQGMVAFYNSHESRMARLPQDRVIGRPFFTEIAPCMNNDMVAHRLDADGALDATIPYVLTFRMRPTPVQLRLLRDAAGARRWVLIQRG